MSPACEIKTAGASWPGIPYEVSFRSLNISSLASSQLYDDSPLPSSFLVMSGSSLLCLPHELIIYICICLPWSDISRLSRVSRLSSVSGGSQTFTL